MPPFSLFSPFYESPKSFSFHSLTQSSTISLFHFHLQQPTNRTHSHDPHVNNLFFPHLLITPPQELPFKNFLSISNSNDSLPAYPELRTLRSCSSNKTRGFGSLCTAALTREEKQRRKYTEYKQSTFKKREGEQNKGRWPSCR